MASEFLKATLAERARITPFNMATENTKRFLATALCFAALTLPVNHSAQAQNGDFAAARQTTVSFRRAPTLGADMSFASTPSPLIEGWLDKDKGDAMTEAFNTAGVRSLRFLFGGLYSPRGPEATAALKAENKLTNRYDWFPLDAYIDFISARDFTTIIGVNVEEGPDIALDAVESFIKRGLKSKIVAIELSNEPWLNYRPWLPEEYAARAADVIERLTPLGVSFALPLTVGGDNNTPTKLTDNEWNGRMLKALAARVDLKNRSDIYGVLHLYSDGVRARSIDFFNKAVGPFAPRMRYLVTEFNIRLGLGGNPHLTNKYAMEFARKVAELMNRPEIEAMYVHSVPSHSIMYWANGKKYATVVGGRDEKLKGDDLSRGWHLTPTGRVYRLYSELAWNGDVIDFHGGGKQSYWAVKSSAGQMVVTLLNDSDKPTKKKVRIAGREMSLSAPPRTIACFDQSGREIERLTLQY
jgi:hypothetical protein